MDLLDTKQGKDYIITEVKGADELVTRLLDMGFTPKCRLHILSLAPFGGTILVSVRNYTIALRFSIAKCIKVQSV